MLHEVFLQEIGQMLMSQTNLHRIQTDEEQRIQIGMQWLWEMHSMGSMIAPTLI